MTAMLSEAERTKLAKLLELLTRTTFVGERDAASLAARRLLDGHNMSWADVISPPAIDRTVPEIISWRETCATLLQHRGLLSQWETTFLSVFRGSRSCQRNSVPCSTE